MTIRKIERHIHCKEKNEKYNTILVKRHENELVKMRYKTKNKYIKLYIFFFVIYSLFRINITLKC